MMRTHGILLKRAAALLCRVGALCALLPAVLAAQGSGPSQAEFSMPGGDGSGVHVDEFTGAFSCDIPVLTVPGPQGSSFDVALTYRSGAPITQDASWVGYGWTLNPGSITRDRRGLPDDWKGEVTYWNKTKRVFTVTASRKLNFEILSKDLENAIKVKPSEQDQPNISLNLSLSTMFNNATGYSRSFGMGAWAKGLMSMDYTSKSDGGSFSVRVEPGLILKGLSLLGAEDKEGEHDLERASRFVAAFTNGLTSYEQHLPAPINFGYTGKSTDYSATFMASFNPAFLSGIEGGIKGSYTWYENNPTTTLKGFGYMYSAAAGDKDLMDYYAEREGAYRKENTFLPIPFTNADNFLVSGSGVGGSFRLHNRGQGQFHTNEVSTTIPIEQAGLDIAVGARFGIGANFGAGSSTSESGPWKDNGANSQYRFHGASDQDPWIFRFRGDLGGNILFSGDDAPMRAAVEDAFGVPTMPAGAYTEANGGGASGRSTYVGYHTIAEMNRKTSTGVYYDSYTRDEATRAFVDRTDQALQDQIGEFCVVNGNGYRYVYGLPVYERAERNIQLGLPKSILDSVARMNSRYMAHAYLGVSTAPAAVGEMRAAPFASNYLITLITTPDYVDRTNDGPTPDDFGGYTKFNYVRAAGRNNKSVASSGWFAWRVPYNGLLYNRNTLSDPSDDMGGYSSGEHEVYYLRSIETKTHIAYFVTNRTNITVGDHVIKGSMTQRLDAYQAYHTSASTPTSEARVAGDSTLTPAGYISLGNVYGVIGNLSQRLERIELYAKDLNDAPGDLLKTVHLEYDSSLRRNLPNARRPQPPPSDAPRAGMLTLKKLWWSGQNVADAEYSPYQFGYQYRTSADYSSEIQQQYPDIVGFADQLSAAEQNPVYSPVDIDPWGNYQLLGGARYAAMKTWVNQAPDANAFDPAAWQLKYITLPTMGEIQVQYEQNTYSYVQDRPAMGMVSLLPDYSNDNVPGGNYYYLNTADIGIPNTDGAAINRLRELIARAFLQPDANGAKERAYFKLLYALVGDTPQRDSAYTTEYVKGYAPVTVVEVETVAGNPTTYRLRLTLKGDRTPKQVCGEFVRKNKMGLMGPEDGIPATNNGPGMITRLLFQYARAGYEESEHCRAVDFANSYIRIPLLYAKRGGGVRVKRLLSMDPGNGTNARLTGSEYVYDEYDEGRHEHVSSGVAVNEPGACREENALVNPWGTWTKPDLGNKIIAGEDLARYEGVPGESLLPAAGVGYSRVVIQNIHEGKSNPGFSVARFYTAKDFPYLNNYSGIGRSVDFTDVKSVSFQMLPLVSAVASAVLPPWLGISVNEDDLWMSQGYRFVLNDMHGQFRSRSAYGGTYADPDSWALASSTEASYFLPGEQIPMLKKPGDPLVQGAPGKEIEVTCDSRSYVNKVVNGHVEGDLSFTFLPLFSVSGSGQGYLSTTSGTLATHVTSKVVRYPAIQKGVLSYADGIYQYARYDAFNPLTGAPVIVHTTDGYDRLKLQMSPGGQVGAYHAYTFPAAGAYPGMGQAATNEHTLLKTTATVTIAKQVGALHTLQINAPADVACAAKARFAVGDLVRLTAAGINDDRGLYHVDAVSGTVTPTITLRPVSASTAALNTQTGNVDVEFVRSGFANLLGASAGNLTTYGTQEALVQGGSDIDLQPAMRRASRQAMANTLTTLVQQGGGNISQNQMQLWDLGIVDLTVGNCIPRAVYVSFPNGPNFPEISLTPFPFGPTSTTLQSAGGYFALDDDGNIVYYPCQQCGCPEPVSCIQFCGDQPLTNVAANVVGASASTYSHIHPYDLTENPATPGDANEYERGARGKWRPTATFGYRTGIVGGSGRAPVDRTYKRAGVFTDFQMFNWKNITASLNTGKWLRLDSVTAYSPNGDPLETVNIEGVYSSAATTYNHTVPLLVATNARYGEVAFQNFEDVGGQQAVLSPSAPLPAHTGVRSLRVTNAVSTTAFAKAKVSNQTVSNGLSVRFWLKVNDVDITAAAPVKQHSVDVRLTAGAWSGTYRIAPQYKVAQTGDWALYEINAAVLPGQLPATVSMALDANLLTAGSPDTVWIDDVRLQPRDAEVRTYVVDRARQRLSASLDELHFATYNQYDASGTLLRQRQETSRGVRTVSERIANLPMVKRYDGTVVPAPDGPPASPRRGGSLRTPGALAGERATSNGSRIDLLDAEINPDGIRTRLLGNGPMRPFDPSSLTALHLDSIGLPEIPVADKLAWMRELAAIEERERAARDSAAAADDIATRAACTASAEQLRAQRAALLGRLGLNETDWAAIKQQASAAAADAGDAPGDPGSHRKDGRDTGDEDGGGGDGGGRDGDGRDRGDGNK